MASFETLVQDGRDAAGDESSLGRVDTLAQARADLDRYRADPNWAHVVAWRIVEHVETPLSRPGETWTAHYSAIRTDPWFNGPVGKGEGS